jgi:hypothetical protein
MGYEVLHGIVDCLRVVGEPISVFKEYVLVGHFHRGSQEALRGIMISSRLI